ncbi:MAG: ATP-binding protein [Gammaproteobacteria bacterium]
MRLNTWLLGRILVNGGLVLTVALAWHLSTIHQASRGATERAASAMQRILELQAVGLAQNAGMSPRFPDFYPVTRVERPDGTCVRLLDAAGRQLYGECRGHHRDDRVPAWFAGLYGAVFMPGRTEQRSIEAGRQRALLEVVPAAEAEIARAWRDTAALVPWLSALVAVLCATVWWSVRRAVEPTHAIIRALNALAEGELDTRLGGFRWREFTRIACACNALGERLAAGQAVRAALSRRLLEVQDAERRALARDLHDEFGQHLSAIGAQAAALRLASAGAAGDAELARIEDSAAHLRELVRGLLVRLHPWSGERFELGEALAGLATERVSGGPRVSVHCDAACTDLPLDVAAAAYRIAQEALTNARRHAAASTVTLAVTCDGHGLDLHIADDGRGADAADLERGFGIAGMRERAAAFGGRVSVTTTAGAGVVVDVHLPVTAGGASP